MQAVKSTYLKALLLLVVFSMNTVVSFACSFSNAFHGDHHHEESSPKEHKHSGGAHKHTAHHHAPAKSHEHSDGTQHNHHSDSGDSEKADDCCSKSVVKIEKTEKAVTKTIEVPQGHFALAFVSAYFYLTTPYTIQKVVYPPHLRWRHPATIQDLRIVIQSFQI